MRPTHHPAETDYPAETTIRRGDGGFCGVWALLIALGDCFGTVGLLVVLVIAVLEPIIFDVTFSVSFRNSYAFVYVENVPEPRK